MHLCIYTYIHIYIYSNIHIYIVCVYEQNYALVIVTQPKREEFPNKFARISQFEYLIQIYKTIIL